MSDAVINVGALVAEVSRQDAKHGSFSASTELGRLRLAIACLEDEVAEVRDAWREERQIDGWPHTTEELLQVASIAMRILREFGPGRGAACTAASARLIEESESYCWAAPPGWGDDVPDKPRCNRLYGHDGNHVMHVEWAPDVDLSAHPLAFGGAAHRAAVDGMLGSLVDERLPGLRGAADGGDQT